MFQNRLNLLAPTCIPWLEYGLLLAVSGGVDSTAMLHLLARLACEHRLPLPIVGHINHRLRGTDSDEDAHFVQSQCAEYGLRCFIHEVTPEEWDQDDSGSREASARKIRYDFLRNTAEHFGCRYLATAHTADDRTETVLHRVFRGTGISGLVGIPRTRQLSHAVTLVRPLIDVRRREILAYLRQIDKNYRMDTTNLEDDFTRNRIRNHLLPLIRQEINPQADRAILRLADLATEMETVLDELGNEVLERSIVQDARNLIILECKQLRHLKQSTVREILIHVWKKKGWPLREMGFEQWNTLAEFLLAGEAGGHRNMPGAVTAEMCTDRSGSRFMLQRAEADSEA